MSDINNPYVKKINDTTSKLFNADSVEYGRNFKTRPSDVFVATYPKCGTTWMSQICHQLRSKGHMDFRDIGEVVIWDALAKKIGQDLDADQPFQPRVFKSHERVSFIAKGGRYVVVTRNPYDAYVSAYKFGLNAFKVAEKDCSIVDFLDVVIPAGNFAEFHADWYKAWKNKEKQILWVSYEDLKLDTKREVTRIAKFMNFSEAEIEERVNVALEMSTMEFMKEYKSKFAEEAAMEVASNQGLDMNSSTQKIHNGKVGSGRNIPPEVIARFEAEWNKHMKETFGIQNYEDFRAKIRG